MTIRGAGPVAPEASWTASVQLSEVTVDVVVVVANAFDTLVVVVVEV